MAGDLCQQFKYCVGSDFANLVYMVLQQLPHEEQLISEKMYVFHIIFFYKDVTLSVVKDIVKEGKPEGGS